VGDTLHLQLTVPAILNRQGNPLSLYPTISKISTFSFHKFAVWGMHSRVFGTGFQLSFRVTVSATFHEGSEE